MRSLHTRDVGEQAGLDGNCQSLDGAIDRLGDAAVAHLEPRRGRRIDPMTRMTAGFSVATAGFSALPREAGSAMCHSTARLRADRRTVICV
jgi:hypothetical protein